MEDPGVDVRIILKWVFEKWNWVVDWIDLTKNRVRLLAVVNAVLNIRVP